MAVHSKRDAVGPPACAGRAAHLPLAADTKRKVPERQACGGGVQLEPPGEPVAAEATKL